MTGNEAAFRADKTRACRGARTSAALALLVLCAADAGASGFLNPRLADPHGHPALSNPYAVYFNPGALGGITGTEVVVDGTLVLRTVDYDRAASALSPNPLGSSLSDPTYVAANTGKAHASNFLALPFVAASSDFGTRRFFAGVATYVPFGGDVKFDQRPEFANRADAPGAVDGTQRWAIVSGVHQSIYNTLVVGFRLPEEGLSFGVGASLVWTRIQHDEARNFDGFDETRTEGRALLDVSGFEGALSAGVYWQVLPHDKLRLGASYQTRPALGRMRLSGTLRQHYASELPTADVDLLQSYPDLIRAGLAARPTRNIEIRLDAEYVTWSLFTRQCIVARDRECSLGPHGEDLTGNVILSLTRSWKDAAAVRAGLGYFVDDKSEIYSGIGWDTSAVPERTLESTYPDANKFLASLGARRRFSPMVGLGASFTLVQYLTTTTGPQQKVGLAGASKMPNEDGEYGSRILFLNVNATFSF
jgi:long-chain fatty acid transport protein